MLRACKLSIRQPIGFIAVLCMAFFNSAMIGSIFGGVGSQVLKAPVLPWDENYDASDPMFTAYN